MIALVPGYLSPTSTFHSQSRGGSLRQDRNYLRFGRACQCMPTVYRLEGATRRIELSTLSVFLPIWQQVAGEWAEIICRDKLLAGSSLRHSSRSWHAPCLIRPRLSKTASLVGYSLPTTT